MSTEEGYFPQGAASRNWTIRKAQATPELDIRKAEDARLSARCAGGPVRRLSPPQRDRSVASRWRPELDSVKAPGFFPTDGYLVLKE
jgi:hypothetical protein